MQTNITKPQYIVFEHHIIITAVMSLLLKLQEVSLSILEVELNNEKQRKNEDGNHISRGGGRNVQRLDLVANATWVMVRDSVCDQRQTRIKMIHFQAFHCQRM